MVRIDIKHGLDIPMGARPDTRTSVMPARVAIQGADFPGLRPHLQVAPGDRVQRGSVLLTDRARPQICLTAPVAGVIAEVRRGARRSLDLLIIEVDESNTQSTDLPTPPATAAIESIRAALQRCGLWTAFRTRPFDRMADPGAVPEQLFVTAIDTHPLAPDPAAVIRERAEAFETGLRLLARLSPATYLCCNTVSIGSRGRGRETRQQLPCPNAAGLECVEFSGPHPAGLPGTHIQLLAQRRGERPRGEIWHIGYQDVLAIGSYFGQGRLDSTRVVSVAGPALIEGRLIETVAGAEISDLIDSELLDPDRIEPEHPHRPGSGGTAGPGRLRTISGPPLSGRLTEPTNAFLGRYHQQVVVLPALSPEETPDSAATGAGMLAVEAFDAIWPFTIPVAPLLRALLTEDTETALALGAAGFVPEDLALCEYVCPSRLDYGGALDRTLERIRQGG